MTRRPHFITTNKSRDYPQQAIWFDTETNLRLSTGELISLEDWKAMTQPLEPSERGKMEVTHELRIGYACYMRRHRNGEWSDEDWCEFTSRDQFWEFVCSKLRPKTRLYLFCHNTGFDLPVLNVFRSLPKLGFTLKGAIIDSPPTVLKLIRGSESITILDTLNIWRMSLEKLGKHIGVPKLPMPATSATKEVWETYGRRDVLIIREACLKWWHYLESNNMGGFGVTLASQSMLLFRAKYMKHRIFIDCNEHALKLTRSGYTGGRTESFRIGQVQERVYYIDVNAMYPAVMHDEQFPTKLIGYTTHATLADIRIWLKQYSVCAQVLLRTNKPFAPLKIKSKLLFPVGQFVTILSTPELLYALDHADILKVQKVAVYDHAPIFREMMHDMNQIKAQANRDGDAVTEFQTKILNNSLYGKTGQNGIKWMETEWVDDLTCKQWIHYDMETGTIQHHRQFCGLKQVKETEGESRESFPAIAGHVTAYARMKLWSLIEQAGQANVYYCDTDSLILNQTGYDRLKHGIDAYKLGAYKLVGTYDDITIHGNKDYTFGDESKTKGVRKDATWLNGWTVSQEQWSGLKSLIRTEQADAPRTKKIVKSLTRRYSKGLVTTQGVVIPHRLNLATLDEALQLELNPDDLA